ncbi:MAG: FAD-dependent oxidoreductase [Candidatus Helarchaeota archaeon]
MNIYAILAHPLRRKILYILDKNGYVQYSELMEKLGLETTGQLNFHLKKLENFIAKDNKAYYLTKEGKRIIKLMNLNEILLSGEDIEYLDTRYTEINRIGIIICNCNTEVSQIIDVNALKNYISKLRNVISVKIFDNLCQEKNLKKITQWVKDNFINKVVIAACSPRSHLHIFERIFEGIIDKYNIEIANIREQCCWVHQDNPDLALKKAKILVEVAIERVSLQNKIQVKKVEIRKSVAILGGGIAGMTLALNLARAGIKVYLIEKSPTIGGKVARWDHIYGIDDCSICFLSELIGELVKEPNITIYTNTDIENVSGEFGNFTLDLVRKPRFVDEKRCTGCKQCMEICPIEKSDQYEFGLINRKLIYIPYIHSYPYAAVIDEEDILTCMHCRICENACVNKAINLNQKPERFQIRVGIKVVAIGADLDTNLRKYHYDPMNDIITSAEFERILSSDGPTSGNLIKLSDKKPPQSIAIIQTVGEQNYSAEFRDLLALKYLDMIKIRCTNCDINIFYEIEKCNNKFLLDPMDPRIHYVENIEIIKSGNKKFILADDKKYEADLIILNVNMVPNSDIDKLRRTMDFTLNENGFMSEETLASGIYGVGTIMGPLSYKSTISQANELAVEIISLLSRDYVMAESSGIEIDEEKCGFCGLCTISCPYNAIIIEENKIMVDKFKCKGCGTCVSVCPTEAIKMNIDTSEKILKSIDIISKYDERPKIIAFCCKSCGYAAADDAGLKKIQYNPNVFIVRVPCTGRVDTHFILKSLEKGIDGVLIIGCKQNACKYIDGSEKLRRKVMLIKDVFGDKIKNKLMHTSLNAVEGNNFVKIVDTFYNNLLKEVKNEA